MESLPQYEPPKAKADNEVAGKITPLAAVICSLCCLIGPAVFMYGIAFALGIREGLQIPLKMEYWAPVCCAWVISIAVIYKTKLQNLFIVSVVSTFISIVLFSTTVLIIGYQNSLTI